MSSYTSPRGSVLACALFAATVTLVLVGCGRSGQPDTVADSGPTSRGSDVTPYLDRIATGEVRWPASQAVSTGVVVLGGARIDLEGSIHGASNLALIQPDGVAMGLAALPDGPLFHTQVSASGDGGTIYVAGERCESGTYDSETGRAGCSPGGLWLGALDVREGRWTVLAPPDDLPMAVDPSAVLLGTDFGLVLFTPAGDEARAWVKPDEKPWRPVAAPPYGWPCQAGGDAVSFNPEERPPNLDEVQSSDDLAVVEVTYQAAVLDGATGTWRKTAETSVEALSGSTSVGCSGEALVAMARTPSGDVVSTFRPQTGWQTTSLQGRGGRVVAANDTTLLLLKTGPSGVVFDPASGEHRPAGDLGPDVLIVHVLHDGTILVLASGKHATIRVLKE